MVLRHWKGNEKWHFSPYYIFTPWIATFFAASRFTRAVFNSVANGAALQRTEELESDPLYGGPLRKLLDKLGSKDDEYSYFPIFVHRDDYDPDIHKLSFAWELLISSLALIQGCLPLVWMYQSFLAGASEGFASWAILIVGIAAPTMEFRCFLKDFRLATKEYEGVVNELFLYIYLASTWTDKQRPTLRDRYRRTIVSNDAYRITHKPCDCACFPEGKGRFPRHPLDSMTSSGPSYGPTNICQDELQLTHIYQAAINMSLPEGVFLYRRLRDWISVDISNERLEVELFMEISAVVACAGVVFIAIMWWNSSTLTAAGTVIIFDSFVVSLFSLKTLNLCALANEYLVDWYERVLVGWLLNVQDPTSRFLGTADESAIGWIWDSKQEELEALYITQQYSKSEPVSVDACLNLSIQAAKVYEDKQRILGFVVTQQLKSSVALSLLAALASIPSLLWEHGDQIMAQVEQM